MVDISNYRDYNDNIKLKGKPVETQGRKAKGLRYFNQNTMIAGCHILSSGVQMD